MPRFVPLISVLVLTGCATPFLTVEDGVIGPRGSAVLAAYLEQEPILGVRDGVENAEIRFYVGGKCLGTARTDDNGRALMHCDLGEATPEFSAATAVWHGRELKAQGRLFEWRTARTAIAVDIDDTICNTDRDDLYFEATDDDSEPIGGSQDVLTELSRDYNILYLTARPRFLLNKTRAWMDAHDFPIGPVVTAPGWRASLKAERYKRETLTCFRRHLPSLLIGIGDKESDAHAYAENGMLAIRIGVDGSASTGPQTVLLANWNTVARFFEANRSVLSAPQRLRGPLERGMIKEELTRF